MRKKRKKEGGENTPASRDRSIALFFPPGREGKERRKGGKGELSLALLRIYTLCHKVTDHGFTAAYYPLRVFDERRGKEKEGRKGEGKGGGVLQRIFCRPAALITEPLQPLLRQYFVPVWIIVSLQEGKGSKKKGRSNARRETFSGSDHSPFVSCPRPIEEEAERGRKGGGIGIRTGWRFYRP